MSDTDDNSVSLDEIRSLIGEEMDKRKSPSFDEQGFLSKVQALITGELDKRAASNTTSSSSNSGGSLSRDDILSLIDEKFGEFRNESRQGSLTRALSVRR